MTYPFSFAVLLSIIFGNPGIILAQVGDSLMGFKRETLENQVEILSELRESVVDASEINDEINYYYDHKINLNTTEVEELKKIPFINEKQIYGIIHYKAIYGDFISFYELQTIDGFGLKDIQQMLPFICIKNPFSTPAINLKNLLYKGRHELFANYHRVPELALGYRNQSNASLQSGSDSKYFGSPDRLYLKYSYRFFNQIQCGFTAEKDPGEEFFKGSQSSGFDFYSGYIMLQHLGCCKKFILGDYQLQFGQGVCLWSGMNYGIPGDLNGNMKLTRGITAYSGSDENNFLRGSALSGSLGNTELTLFYSSHFRDAHVQVSPIDNEIIGITGFNDAGLHRTLSEIAMKHLVKQSFYGGHIQLKKARFKAGITYYETLLNHPVLEEMTPYATYDFSGNRNRNLGLDYLFLHPIANVYGELGYSKNGGYGWIQGVDLFLYPSVLATVVYRNFSSNYQSLLANADALSGNCQNESGWLLRMRTQIYKRITLTAYADLASFSWLRYRTDAPSRAAVYSTQVVYNPNMKTEFFCRYRYSLKQINQPIDNKRGIAFLDNIYRESLRFYLRQQVSRSLLLKTQMEILGLKQDGCSSRNGFVAFQDVVYRFDRPKIALSIRYAVFDTDTYDERIYVYEQNVPHENSSSSYYYKGSRYYLMLQFGLGHSIDLWLRWAQTLYANLTTIGSGLESIAGDTKSDLSVELRLKF